MRQTVASAFGVMFFSLLLAGTVQAQPAPPTLPAAFSQDMVSLPAESCSSQNNKCLNICDSRPTGSAQEACIEDCDWRINYCRNESGVYPWRRGKSVWVGERK
jgi:hypothetical protein